MVAQNPSTALSGGLIQRFRIERHGLRGRLVRLGALVDGVLDRHRYPEPVAVMLGQTLALAAALADGLKYEGVFTLQTRGDGPVTLMVADVTSEGRIRGYAQYDRERLAATLAAAPDGRVGDSVPQLLGAGHLAFTVDQGPETERYQGVVELSGSTLADCVHHHFRQSDQLDAAVKVAVGRAETDAGKQAWQAGAMMIQRLPGNPRANGPLRASFEESEEGWREAVVLMGSATAAELIDPGIAPNVLLYRLFHEPGVRVYKPIPLNVGCRCSRQRVADMLRSFPRSRIEELKIDGEVIVTCEFCATRYVFDEDLLAELYES